MASNLRQRLEHPEPHHHQQQQQQQADTQAQVRHDLLEIDRKRKLLLDEDENIKRIKLEQVFACFKLQWSINIINTLHS